MNKDELLQELNQKIISGEISRQDIINSLGSATAPENKKDMHFSVTKMLYVLGAAIVVVGIVIFVAQIWNDIGSVGRITITLGLGLVFTAIGSMLLNKKSDDSIGTVFHFIGGMMIPGGAIVTLLELSTGPPSTWPLAITFGIIFAFYSYLASFHKSALLTLFAIGNGTAFLYILVESITAGSFLRHGDLYAYLTMITGASYLLLAHYFRDGWNYKLIGILYFFGITGLLGAAFSQVFDYVIWQLLYFGVVLGGLYLAVYLRNRSILVMSTLFLVAHISFITSEYFANSLGWPLSLVALGFIFIGLGYASITINKRYIVSGK